MWIFKRVKDLEKRVTELEKKRVLESLKYEVGHKFNYGQDKYIVVKKYYESFWDELGYECVNIKTGEIIYVSEYHLDSDDKD